MMFLGVPVIGFLLVFFCFIISCQKCFNMKFQNCFLVPLISTLTRVGGEQVEIRLESDPSFPRLPFVDVRVVHIYRSSRFETTWEAARMLFHTDEFYLFHPRLLGEEDSVTVAFNSQGSPVMESSREELFVVRDNYVGTSRSSGRRTPSLYYGAKKSAGFAAEVGSFVLTPFGEDMKLVVRPEDPQEFCNEDSGNTMTYISTTSDVTSWSIYASVRVLPFSGPADLAASHGVGVLEVTPNESVFPYHISSGDAADKIPYETLEMLKGSISQTGAIIDETTSSTNGFVVSNCTDNIGAFPAIQYSLYNRRDIRITKMVDIVLTAEDYATVSGDTCTVHFTTADTAAAQPGALGMNLLRSVTVHFDTVNNRVGLCDFRDI